MAVVPIRLSSGFPGRRVLTGEHPVGRVQARDAPRSSRSTKDGSLSAAAPNRAGGVPVRSSQARTVLRNWDARSFMADNLTDAIYR